MENFGGYLCASSRSIGKDLLAKKIYDTGTYSELNFKTQGKGPRRWWSLGPANRVGRGGDRLANNVPVNAYSFCSL